jgi:hypothetical protein
MEPEALPGDLEPSWNGSDESFGKCREQDANNDSTTVSAGSSGMSSTVEYLAL